MKTTMNHTPGPWSVLHTPVGSHIKGRDDSSIASAEYANHEADGDLIAAAPDLLAALEAIRAAGLVMPSSNPQEYSLMCRAIARACDHDTACAKSRRAYWPGR